MSIIIAKRRGAIEKAIYEALEHFQYKPKKSKIFIKPNIVNPFPPGAPFIANCKVVAGIISYLQARSYKDIVVGEGPIDPDTEYTFKYSGYTKMCKSKNVALLDLNKAERAPFNFKDKQILLPKLLLDHEYILVSKMKTHIQTTVTLGLKNQKGLLALSDKRMFHKSLHENIAHLAKAVSPDLSIIDGIKAIEGNGPGTMGNVIKDMNVVIIGDNLLATDCIACKIMGIAPENVRHLKIAHEIGVQKMDDEIKQDVRLDEVRRKFKLPLDHHKILNIYYHWDDFTCSGCSGIMGDLKREIFRHPIFGFKLFLASMSGKINFITGINKSCVGISGKKICIGNCVKKYAIENNCFFVEGCPPKPRDIINILKKALRNR